MADAVVIQEFLATLGYNVDEASQRRFVDSLESIGKTIAGLSLGLTGLAGTIMGVVSSMAGSASQMGFISQNLGETVTNIERAIYMWQRLGVAPAETLKAMQSIQQMRLHEPGLFQRFSAEDMGGQGSPEQQLEHFLERFRRADAATQFQMRRLFGQTIGEQLLLADQSRGDQAAAGGQEFNFVNRLFHFDPDRFATESNAFEQAWMSFHLRINTWFKSNVAEPLTVLETQALRGLSDFIDKNGPEITKKLEDIGRSLRDGLREGLDVIRDLIGWFEKLPAGAKQAAEAIVGISGALLLLQANPAIASLIALSYVLKKLVDDYEAWRQAGSKGVSPLGIDYTAIGKSFEYLLTKADEVAKALGGWENILIGLAATVGGAKFLGVFLRAFTAIETAAVAAGTTIAATTRGLMAALGPVLAAIAVVETFTKATNPETYAPQNLAPNSPFWRGLPASEFRKRFPDQPLPPGMIEEHGPGRPSAPEAAAAHAAAATPAPAAPTGEERSGIWKGLKDFLTSGFGLIGTAHGEELPDNLKQLNTSVSGLDDTLKDWLEQHLFGGGEGGLDQGGLFGGGGGIPGSVGGGSGGGGGGGSVNWKDPNVIKAIATFQGMGYSMEDAVGIVTNLWAESGLKTNAVNPTGHVGVAQWDRTRQMEFMMLNAGKRIQDATLEEQLKFIDYELHHKEQAALARLQNARGVQQKIGAFGEGYERYGSEAETRRRMGLASGAPTAQWYAGPMRQSYDQSRSANITQTNNVTVNAAGGSPNDFIQAWDNQLYRQHADLQRRGQAQYH